MIVFAVVHKRQIETVAVGAIVVSAIALALLYHPHMVHAGAANKVFRHVVHEAVRQHRGQHLRPHGPRTLSPERYLWESFARIIRDIGHKRMAGVWPWVPPGAPGIGGSAGLPL